MTAPHRPISVYGWEMSVFEMANELHTANIGDGMSTHRRAELEGFLRWKLDNWGAQLDQWAAYDGAVKMLIEAVLSEPTDARQCCRRDHDFDGNCDRHPAKLKLETAPARHPHCRGTVHWAPDNSQCKACGLYGQCCDRTMEQSRRP